MKISGITKYGLLLIGAAVLYIPGCGHSYLNDYVAPKESFSSVTCVGILPFENLSEEPNIDRVVPELLATELYITKRFDIMEESEVRRQFSKKSIVLPKKIDPSLAQKLGKILNVDAIITGTVLEYWYRDARQKASEMEPSVGLSLKMIDVQTGIVLWTASLSRSSYDIFPDQRDPINRVAQLALKNAVGDFSGIVPSRVLSPDSFCGSRSSSTITASAPAYTPPPIAAPPVPQPEPPKVFGPPPKLDSPTPVVEPKSFTKKEQVDFLEGLKSGKNFTIEGIKYEPQVTTLSQEAKTIFADIADVLKAFPEVKIKIIGHTDSVEAPANADSLSLERALEVRNYLVKSNGIPESTLQVEGRGGAEPILPNINQRGRERNRRIEVLAVTPPQQ